MSACKETRALAWMRAALLGLEEHPLVREKRGRTQQTKPHTGTPPVEGRNGQGGREGKVTKEGG